MAKESINLKEAIQIAKIIMVVPEERMPIIREVFEMAGVDIESLGEIEEFKALTEQETLEELYELLECVAKGREITNGEYRISPQEFKSICEEKGLNAHRARGQLAGLGIIRQSAWTGGHAVTVCTVREDGSTVRRICIYEDWRARIEKARQ